MIWNLLVASALLVGLSFLAAFVAARWVSRPIQRLTGTAHEIAAGNFGGRVDLEGLSFEFADLAEDFNQMSGHIGRYVQQLRQAAQVNRDLFIGSLRAFVAAIDAKDPYTRGHSERVAAVSRVDRPLSRARPRTCSTRSGSARCCTTSARSASRTRSCARRASSRKKSSSR